MLLYINKLHDTSHDKPKLLRQYVSNLNACKPVCALCKCVLYAYICIYNANKKDSIRLLVSIYYYFYVIKSCYHQGWKPFPFNFFPCWELCSQILSGFNPNKLCIKKLNDMCNTELKIDKDRSFINHINQ